MKELIQLIWIAIGFWTLVFLGVLFAQDARAAEAPMTDCVNVMALALGSNEHDGYQQGEHKVLQPGVDVFFWYKDASARALIIGKEGVFAPVSGSVFKRLGQCVEEGQRYDVWAGALTMKKA